MNLDFASFVAFDFETTGLSSCDKITEIGAVKVEQRRLTERFSRLVNPGIPIPRMIQELTSITDTMVSDAPAIESVLPEFLRFIGDYPLIAHNAKFDCRFLYRELAALGRFIHNPVADTVTLARRVWSGLPSYKLSALTERFHIEQSSAHRAWCDAEVTARLYLLMGENRA